MYSKAKQIQMLASCFVVAVGGGGGGGGVY